MTQHTAPRATSRCALVASRCGAWLAGWPPVDLHQRCKGKSIVSSRRRNGEESMPANTVIPIGDFDLSTAVRRRLELELGLTHEVVKVTVLNGEVTLRGRMACPLKREAAKVTAESVGGVRRVLNDISTAYYMAGSPADRSQEGCASCQHGRSGDVATSLSAAASPELATRRACRHFRRRPGHGRAEPPRSLNRA
ncbi:BON domain-containing protein [Rhizobium sp. SRDI969]|uniref:BON domain-containing protein n=1 Tax=Rhizobium sp. SRDI969 TaxID=3138252 RepID=UPI002882D94B|nr:BON domain-containing protein [Rhizobium leguminosarum]